MGTVARQKRKRIRWLRGWRLLLILFAGFSLLGVWDAAVKASAPGEGFCPASATWILAAEDFGRFCSDLSRTNVADRVRHEWPKPTADLQLSIRLTTGIRPTPLRWNFWMGKRFLAAGSEDGAGLCVYPGLWLRGLDRIRGFLQPAPAANSIREFRGYSYAWREGFLIVSRSPGYIRATLEAPSPELDPSGGPHQIRFRWKGPREGALCILARDDLPVEGRIRAGVVHRETPLTLAGGWPEPPLAFIASSRWDTIQAILALLEQALASTAVWPPLRSACETVYGQWALGSLPDTWDRGVDQCALGLMDVDTSAGLPVPEIALILRSIRSPATPHPLLPLVAPVESIDFEWQEHPGTISPLVGEKLSLCLGRYDRDWFATSQEPLMEKLVGHVRDDQPASADVQMVVSWAKAGAIAEILLERAGDLELIPGRGPLDVKAGVIPLARAVSRLGELRLDGHGEGAWLTFRGTLARDHEPEAAGGSNYGKPDER